MKPINILLICLLAATVGCTTVQTGWQNSRMAEISTMEEDLANLVAVLRVMNTQLGEEDRAKVKHELDYQYAHHKAAVVYLVEGDLEKTDFHIAEANRRIKNVAGMLRRHAL